MKSIKLIQRASRIMLYSAVVLSMVISVSPVFLAQANPLANNPILDGEPMDDVDDNDLIMPVDDFVDGAPEEFIFDEMDETTGDSAIVEDDGMAVAMDLVGAGTGTKTLTAIADDNGDPAMVEVEIEAGGSPSTLVTLSGFNPGQEYHLYRDEYSNYEAVVADASGNISYYQDASSESLAWIQTVKSTHTINYSPGGLDCEGTMGGTWTLNGSGHGTCTLPVGFTTNETIDVNGDNITLDCNGATIIGFDGTGNGVDARNFNNMVVKNCNVTGWSYGIRVGGGTGHQVLNNHSYDNVSRAIYALNAPGIEIAGNETSGGVFGIYVHESDNALIHMDNYVHDHTSSGFVLYYTNSAHVSGNRTANNGVYGSLVNFSNFNTFVNHTSTNDYRGWGALDGEGNSLLVSTISDSTYAGATSNLRSSGTVIADNTISNSNRGVYSGAPSTQVINNQITNSESYGIIFDGEGVGPVTIKGNTVNTTLSSVGIEAKYAPNSVIGGTAPGEGNTVINPFSQGIRVRASSGVQVIGNTVEGATSEPPGAGIGIYVYDTSPNAIVQGNTVDNNYHGIFVHTADNSVVVSNTATNSIMNGISMSYVTDGLVDANTVSNSGQDGISFYRNIRGFVRDNNVSSSGRIGLHPHGASLLIEPTITNNTVTDSDLYGIHYRGGRDGFCTNNQVNNSGSIGIEVRGAARVTVSGNIINNSDNAGIRFQDSVYCNSSNNRMINTEDGLNFYNDSVGNTSDGDSTEINPMYASYGYADPKGIQFLESRNNTVTNFLHVDSSPSADLGCSMGIYTASYIDSTLQTYGNTVSNSIFDGVCHGVRIGYQTFDNSFTNNTFHTQAEGDVETDPTGVYLWADARDNVFTGNTFNVSDGSGIWLWDLTGTGNTFYDNTFDAELALKNPQAGTVPVLLDNGVDTGNTWTSPNGDGYAEACLDADENLVCDFPYNADPGQSNSIDNYALVYADRPDSDSDGYPDAGDNCPTDHNPLQSDLDQDGIGDACDTETAIDNTAGTAPLAIDSDDWNLVVDPGQKVIVDYDENFSGGPKYDFTCVYGNNAAFAGFFTAYNDAMEGVMYESCDSANSTAQYYHVTPMQAVFNAEQSFLGLYPFPTVRRTFDEWAPGLTALEARNHFLDNYDGVADGRSDLMIGSTLNLPITVFPAVNMPASAPQWSQFVLDSYGAGPMGHFFAHFSFDLNGDVVTNSSTVITEQFYSGPNQFSLTPIDAPDPTTGLANWVIGDSNRFDFYTGIPAGQSLVTTAAVASAIDQADVEVSMVSRPNEFVDIDTYVVTDASYEFRQESFSGSGETLIVVRDTSAEGTPISYCVVSPSEDVASYESSFNAETGSLTAITDVEIRLGEDCVLDGDILPEVEQTITLAAGQYYNVSEDTDGDGYVGSADNCPGIYNPGQENLDDDTLGDVCDFLTEKDFSTTETTSWSFMDMVIISDADNDFTFSYNRRNDASRVIPESNGQQEIVDDYIRVSGIDAPVAVISKDSHGANNVAAFAIYHDGTNDASEMISYNRDVMEAFYVRDSAELHLVSDISAVIPANHSLDLSVIEDLSMEGSTATEMWLDALDKMDEHDDTLLAAPIFKVTTESSERSVRAKMQVEANDSTRNSCHQQDWALGDYEVCISGDMNSAYYLTDAHMSSGGGLIARSGAAVIAVRQEYTGEYSSVTVPHPFSFSTNYGTELAYWGVGALDGQSSPFEQLPRIIKGLDVNGVSLMPSTGNYRSFNALLGHFDDSPVGRYALHLPFFMSPNVSATHPADRVNLEGDVHQINMVKTGNLSDLVYLHAGPGISFETSASNNELGDMLIGDTALCALPRNHGDEYGVQYGHQIYPEGAFKNIGSSEIVIRFSTDCQVNNQGDYTDDRQWYQYIVQPGDLRTVEFMIGVDRDFVPDQFDVCPSVYDPQQGDFDVDWETEGGDACDERTDGILRGSTQTYYEFEGVGRRKCHLFVDPNSEVRFTADYSAVTDDDMLGNLSASVINTTNADQDPAFAIICEPKFHDLIWDEEIGLHWMQVYSPRWLGVSTNDKLVLSEVALADSMKVAGSPFIFWSSYTDLPELDYESLGNLSPRAALFRAADLLDGIQNNQANYVSAAIVPTDSEYADGVDAHIAFVWPTDEEIGVFPNPLGIAISGSEWAYPTMGFNPLESLGTDRLVAKYDFDGYLMTNPKFTSEGVRTSRASLIMNPIERATRFSLLVDRFDEATDPVTGEFISVVRNSASNWSYINRELSGHYTPGYRELIQTWGGYSGNGDVLMYDVSSGALATIEELDGEYSGFGLTGFMGPRERNDDNLQYSVPDYTQFYPLSWHVTTTDANGDGVLSHVHCVNAKHDAEGNLVFTPETYCINSDETESYVIENDGAVSVEPDSVGTVEIRYYTDNIVDETTGELPPPEYPIVTLAPGDEVPEAVLDDIDEDGFTNDVDQCLGVAGPYQGCPAKSDLTVELHIVDQTKTLCPDNKVSCKLPMGDVEVMVMEMPADYTPKDADLYFDLGLRLGENVSLTDGTATVNHLTGTSYLAVARWAADASTWVYTSKEVVNGMADLKYMKQVKSNGTVRYLAASVVVTHGSLLETIFPQYFVWENTVEYYPVTYVTSDNWTIDVCADAPEGYELTSILDENDQVVSTTECMHTVIPGDPRLFLFEVTDLQSPSPDLEFDLTVGHDGKTKKHKVKVPGYRQWMKAEMQAAKKAEMQAAKDARKAAKVASAGGTTSVNGTTLVLARNQSVWDAAASQLSSNANDDQIKALAKVIAERNNIAVPEWGITGARSANTLSTGTTLDISGLTSHLWELNR